MSENELLSVVREFAIKNYEKDDIHGFPHVERVYNMCEKMGVALGANMKVLKIAALLHDIGRAKENIDFNSKNHAEISAEMAMEFLNSVNHEFNKSDLYNISHSIKAHSFSNNLDADTLEAQILSDADKLDALGAIGIYRTIGFTIKNGGGIREVLEHLKEKILKLYDLIYLDYSKIMAKERTVTVENFRLILDVEI